MGKGRELQVIAQVACAECGAPIGRACGYQGHRPVVHGERRRAWQATKPADALDADITLSYQHEGPQRQTVLVFAPLSALGRRVMPTLERLAHDAGVARLRELQARGIVVMRED